MMWNLSLFLWNIFSKIVTFFWKWIIYLCNLELFCAGSSKREVLKQRVNKMCFFQNLENFILVFVTSPLIWITISDSEIPSNALPCLHSIVKLKSLITKNLPAILNKCSTGNYFIYMYVLLLFQHILKYMSSFPFSTTNPCVKQTRKLTYKIQKENQSNQTYELKMFYTES